MNEKKNELRMAPAHHPGANAVPPSTGSTASTTTSNNNNGSNNDSRDGNVPSSTRPGVLRMAGVNAPPASFKSSINSASIYSKSEQGGADSLRSEKTDKDSSRTAPTALHTAVAIEIDEDAIFDLKLDEKEKQRIEQAAVENIHEKFQTTVAQGEATDVELEEKKKNQRQRCRWIIIVIALLLITGTAVAVAVALSNDKATPKDTDAPTVSPTLTPTVKPPIFAPVAVTPAPGAPPSVTMPPVVSSEFSFPDNTVCEGAYDIAGTIGEPFFGEITNDATTALEDTCEVISRNGLGIWYRMEGDGSRLSASTCEGTGIDTQISVFVGFCGKLRCVAGNDQMAGCGSGDQSVVGFSTEVGSTYYIYVHSRRRSGLFQLDVSPLPDNDECVGATPLVFEGERVFGSTRGAMIDDVSCDGDMPTSGGIWFSITGMGDLMRARTFTENTSFSTSVMIFQGSDCGQLTCVGPGSTWWSEEGVTYYILVFGQASLEGDFQIDVDFGRDAGYCCGTPNTDCQAPGVLFPGLAVTSTTADEGYDRFGSCGDLVFATSTQVWYLVTGTGGIFTASTCDTTSDFDTQISVFRGGCDSLECIDGNDQACGDQSSVSWFTEENEPYFVVVHGFSDRDGQFTLRLDETEIDVTSNCSTAVEITPDGTSILATTVDHVETEFFHCQDEINQVGPALWYNVTGTGSPMIASTCRNSEDVSSTSSIFIFTGGCDDLDCTVIESRDACGSHESVVWETIRDMQYYILIQANDQIGNGGTDFVFTVQDAVANDLCQNPVGPLSVDSTLTFGSTWAASIDDDFTSTSRGVFYTVEGTGHELTASTCSEFTSFHTDVKVFRGDCTNPQPIITTSVGESCELGNYVRWDSQENELYYILLTGATRDDFGNFALTISGPAIDSCFGAFGPIPTDSSIIVGSNENATPDNLYSWYNSLSPGVWYTFVGTGQPLTITTCHDIEASIDVTMKVFSGNCENLNWEYGFQDFDLDCETRRYEDDLAAGQVYYLLIESISVGDFSISLNNDGYGCSSSEELTLPDDTLSAGEVISTTFGAPLPNEVIADNGGSACTLDVSRPTRWYSVEGVGASITIVGGGDSPTSCDLSDGLFCCGVRIAVFEGTCGSPLSCAGINYDTNEVCRGDGSVSFVANYGQNYYVAVQTLYDAPSSPFSSSSTSSSSSIGNNFFLQVTNTPHDSCSSAVPPTLSWEGQLTVEGSIVPEPIGLVPATEQQQVVPPPFVGDGFCDSLPENEGNAFWYSVVGKGRPLAASTCNYRTNFDTQIAIFSGSCDVGLVCVAANDQIDTETCDDASTVRWYASEDTLYYIRVDGYFSSGGTFQLHVLDETDDEVSCPTSDEIVRLNSDSSTQITDETIYNDPYQNALPCDSTSSPGKWYDVIGTGQTLSINTCDPETTFDTIISVFRRTDDTDDGDDDGICNGEIMCVVQNDNVGDDSDEGSGIDHPCGDASWVTFPTESGVRYYILIQGSKSWYTGKFVLRSSWVIDD